MTIDGSTAFNVNMTGIPAGISALIWDGVREVGVIQYGIDPATGIMPDPGSFSDPNDYEAQITEAEAIIYAQQNPVIYYFTQETTFSGRTFLMGDAWVSTEVGYPAPPNTTEDVPPAPSTGQTLYWYEGAWLLSSFNPSFQLSQAQTSLINQVNQDAAIAVGVQSSGYSDIQKITAPDVNALDTLDYPGTTLGDYQTYVNGLSSSAIATINAATTTGDLYSFNPAEVAFSPSATGVINTGRGGGVGPQDLNVSYFTTWNSDNVDEDGTELYIPGTDTVIPYTAPAPNSFDSLGNCFAVGDYLVQIRQASTGFVLAEYICPLNPTGEEVSF